MNDPIGGWGYALRRVVGALVVGYLLGLFVGHPWWGVTGALAGYLALQLINLWQLDDWLRHRNRRDPPDTGGLWGEIVSLVSRLHRRKQFHKQRALALFRELRRSTASMPDGVVALNAAKEIIWFNRKAAEMLGLRRKLDFGINVASLLRAPEFARYLETGKYDSTVLVRQIGRAHV